MAFLKNIAASLVTKIVPNVVENLFPVTKDIVRKFKDESQKSKELLGGVRNDVRATINQFEGVNPTYRRLMKQVKTGKFGLNSDELSEIEDKAMGFDFSGLDDMGDFNSDFESGSSSESSESTDLLGGIYHAVTGVSDGDAILSGQMNQSISMTRNIGMETIHILASVNKNIALMTAFQAEQTKSYYDASLDFFRVSSSFQQEMSDGYKNIFEKYEEDKRNREMAKRNSRNEHDEASDVFNFSKVIDKTISKTNLKMFFGESGMFSESIARFNKDPLGTMAELSLTTIMDTVFKRPIEAVNLFLKDLPYKANELFDSWSNNSNTDIFGSIKRFVGGMFKLNIDPNKKITGGKFLDGPVDFDGKVHFAITDVIPMYLRKILQGIRNSNEIMLTGAPTSKDEIIFDYTTGALVSSDKLMKDLKADVKRIKDQPYAHSETLDKIESETKARNRAIESRNNAALANNPAAVLEDLIPELSYTQQKALTANLRELYNDNNGKVNKNDIAAMDHYKINGNGDFELDASGNKIKDDDLKNALAKLTAALQDTMDVNANLASDTRSKRHKISEDLNRYQDNIMGTAANSLLAGSETDINDIKDLPLNWNTMTDAEKIRQIKDYPNDYTYKQNGKTWKVEPGTTPGSEILIQRRRGGPIVDPMANSARNLNPGNIRGEGTGTSDSILARVSNGEFIIKANMARKYNEVLEKINNGTYSEQFSSGVDNLHKKLQDKVGYEEDGSPIPITWDNLKEVVAGTVNDAANKYVIDPMKSAFKKTSDSLQKAVFDPMKKSLTSTLLGTTGMKGKEGSEKLGLSEAFNLSFKENILEPFKLKLLGPEKYADKTKDGKEVGLIASIADYTNTEVLDPMKKKLLGEARYNELTKDGKKLGIFGTIMDYTHTNILTPMKQFLLGDERHAELTKDGKKVSMFFAVKESFSNNIIDPLKTLMVGSDTRDYIKSTNNGKDFTLWQYAKTGLNERVLEPLKNLLVGGEKNRSTDEKKDTIWNYTKDRISKTTESFKRLIVGDDRYNELSNKKGKKLGLVSSMFTAYNERILEPFKGMIFGEENKKGNLFKLIYSKTTSFFNKLLFGFDKAKTGSIFKNLLDVTKKAVKSLTGDIGAYTLNIFRDRYMPIMKDFLKEGSSYLMEKLNIFKGQFAIEFKKISLGLLGDKNIERLRKFIVIPLETAMTKLTSVFSTVFKNLLKLPAMGLEKLTDSIKRSRMKSGNASYDADETKRLLENKSRFASWESEAIRKREGRLQAKMDRTSFGSSTPEDVTALNTQRTAENTKRIEELMQQQLDASKQLEQTLVDIDSGNDSAEERNVKKHEAKQAHDAKQAELKASLEERKNANRKTDKIEGGVKTAEELAEEARQAAEDGADGAGGSLLGGPMGGMLQNMMALGAVGILKKMAGFIFKFPMMLMGKVFGSAASLATQGAGLAARGGISLLGGAASLATRTATGAVGAGSNLLNNLSGTGVDGNRTSQQLREYDANIINDNKTKLAERTNLQADKDLLNNKIASRQAKIDALASRDPNSLTEREEKLLKQHREILEKNKAKLGGIDTRLTGVNNHLNDESNKAAVDRSTARDNAHFKRIADAQKHQDKFDRSEAEINRKRADGTLTDEDLERHESHKKNRDRSNQAVSDADRDIDKKAKRRGQLKGAGLGGLALMGGDMLGKAIGGDIGATISGITGYMGMGAMLGSIAGPVGTAAGAAAGGLLYLFTEPKAMDEMGKLADGAMSFIDTLPDKIEAFTNKIPEKIGAFFGMDQDPETITYDKDGNPTNLKPNLLSMIGGIFFRLQGMLMGIVPKVIGVVYSLVASSVISVAFGMAQGIGNIVLSIFDGVTNALMGIKHYVNDLRAKLPDWMPFSMTKAEADKIKADDINEHNQNSANRRKSFNETLIGVQQSANATIKEQSKAIGSLGSERAKAVSDFGKDLMGGANVPEDKKVDGKPQNMESKQTVSAGDSTDNIAKKAVDLSKSAIATFEQMTANASSATDAAGAKLNVDISKYTAKTDGTLDINGSATTRVGTSSEDVNKAIHLAAISNEGQALGLSEDTLHALAMIESSKNPLIDSPGKHTYKGLYQIGPDVARQYGITGKEHDPYSNASAAVKYMLYNSKILRKNGIPISGTSLYLAHQQGASGFTDIYNSAVKGTPMSDTRIKLMLNNVPPNSGIANPVDYIKYYNARIAAGGKAFNLKEIASAIGTKSSAADTIAKNLSTPTSTPTTSNTVASKVTATKTDSIAANTAKAMEDTIKTSSAQNENAANATKQALLPNSTPETGIVDELRKQSTILERIASNTKEGTNVNLFNGISKEEEASKIKEMNRKSNNSNSKQLSFNTEDDIMRPGTNTLAIARGMSV